MGLKPAVLFVQNVSEFVAKVEKNYQMGLTDKLVLFMLSGFLVLAIPFEVVPQILH